MSRARTFPGLFRTATAAAAGTWVASGVAVALSAPSLTRPLGPGLLLVLVPSLGAGVVAGLLAACHRSPAWRRLVGIVVAALASAPALLIAATPLSHSSLGVWVAPVAAVLVVVAVGRRGGPWGLLATSAVLVLLLFWVRGPRVMAAVPDSVVVLGFDAATWDVMDGMIEAGELPSFRRLQEQGATGVLHSSDPSASPVVWTTLATGVAPVTHGIGDFWAGRQDIRVGRFWDEVVQAGSTAGVVGWLLNWPPDPDLDFTAPGWLAGGYDCVPEAAAPVAALIHSMHHPIELPAPKLWVWASALAISRADHAWTILGHKSRLALTSLAPEQRKWRTHLMRAALREDLFLALMERHAPQLGALVTYPTDSLGHWYWKYHEPEPFEAERAAASDDLGRVVRDCYRLADRTLGAVLDRVDLGRTTVVVISDHGMEAQPESERVLRIRESNLLRRLGLDGRLQAYSLAGVVTVSPVDEGLQGQRALDEADGLFTEARNLDLDRPLFMVTREPGMVQLRLDPAHGLGARLRIGGQVVEAREVCEREGRSGRHTLRGVVGLIGRGVSSGEQVEARLVDVAPTVLHLLGLPVPGNLEGQVIEAALSPTWRQQHPVETRSGDMRRPEHGAQGLVDDSVEERLRELGYVR